VHECEKDKIGIFEKVDCALAFYVIHEVPDQENLLKELRSILKRGGILYMIEPRLHVSRGAFGETLKKAKELGFKPLDRPRVFLSRAAVFER
jgi:ubiquinone/menaquinone biosynthesis C-methylase UbiE